MTPLLILGLAGSGCVIASYYYYLTADVEKHDHNVFWTIGQFIDAFFFNNGQALYSPPTSQPGNQPPTEPTYPMWLWWTQ